MPIPRPPGRLLPLPSGQPAPRVSGAKTLGEARLGAGHVDAQERVVACRVEGILGGDNLAPEQPGEPAGIEVAALEGVCAEMLPQCGEKNPCRPSGRRGGGRRSARAPFNGVCTGFSPARRMVNWWSVPGSREGKAAVLQHRGAAHRRAQRRVPRRSPVAAAAPAPAGRAGRRAGRGIRTAPARNGRRGCGRPRRTARPRDRSRRTAASGPTWR